MKVLVIGASGFIGRPVADAFVRAGHIVYGQTRSAETARELAKDEIVPVVCDPMNEEGGAIWAKVAGQADVVVDVLKGAGAAAAKQTFHRFLSSISHRPAGSPKATYIYTSGLWYMSRGHGGLDKWSDERQPPSDYNQAVQWRGEIENAVLQGKSAFFVSSRSWNPDRCHPGEDGTGKLRLKLTRPEKSVHGIVIRPPIMYGRSQSFVASYILDAAYEAGQRGESFETFVNAESRWQTCHQDDVGDLFARIGERGPICSGQVFLASNLQSERLTDVLDAVVRVSGAKGYKAKKAEAPYDTAWVSTLHARPSLGAALVGWTPKKMGLVDGMDVYWASYLASRQDGGKLAEHLAKL